MHVNHFSVFASTCGVDSFPPTPHLSPPLITASKQLLTIEELLEQRGMQHERRKNKNKSTKINLLPCVSRSICRILSNSWNTGKLSVQVYFLLNSAGILFLAYLRKQRGPRLQS